MPNRSVARNRITWHPLAGYLQLGRASSIWLLPTSSFERPRSTRVFFAKVVNYFDVCKFFKKKPLTNEGKGQHTINTNYSKLFRNLSEISLIFLVPGLKKNKLVNMISNCFFTT